MTQLLILGTGEEMVVARMLGRNWAAAGSGQVFRYRSSQCLLVRANNQVQAIRSSQTSGMFAALSSALPLVTAHQGVWNIEEYADHFTITSREAKTFGPFGWIDQVQEKLDVFGLELRSVGSTLKGYSHFAECSSGCLVDSIDRLYWLENQCWTANVAVGKAAKVHWAAAVDEVFDAIGALNDPEDVVNPLALAPGLPPRMRWSNYA